MLPSLQLALALGLFERTYNETTGLHQRKLTLEDANGLSKYFHYPETLLALFELPAQPPLDVAAIDTLIVRLTMEQAEAVEKRVDLELGLEKYRTATARDELKRKLQGQLEAVYENRKKNDQDPIYVKMHDACTAAIERIK